jgi:hypothetical protein
VQFVDPPALAVALAVVWAVAMPLCMLLARKLDGVAPGEAALA